MHHVMGPKCARTVPLLIPTKPAVQRLHAWDAHISAPYARTIASRPTNARRGMRSASRSTAHNQKAQQATNTCTRVRACVAPQPAEHSPPPGRGLPHRLQHDFPGEAQAGTGQAKGFVKQAKGFGRSSRAREGIFSRVQRRCVTYNLLIFLSSL